ncbi:myb-like DNA-binding domain, shaqkyf class protein [Medicago truncatula]|uniref:Myb-like DNA-binding domain, shaqkyf class protein n=1 Tax=Medicago truncatula TaxID=3880 RepID=A0A072VLS7_MEDTR|nr:myb-like DNA-binding domain, shaqkyf class protein [Medicago truncatula]
MFGAEFLRAVFCVPPVLCVFCEFASGLIPWTEEEHKLFSVGLQKVDKGDWRGISRNYVKTRTPSQVASHAQKYFLCRSNRNCCRHRSSLFDITTDRGYFLLAIVRNVNVKTNLFHLKMDSSLKPVATLDDYLANVVPLFGGFLSILGVSELATWVIDARYGVKLSPLFLVPSNALYFSDTYFYSKKNGK